MNADKPPKPLARKVVVSRSSAVTGLYSVFRVAVPVHRLIGLETVVETAVVVVPGGPPGGTLGFALAHGAPLVLWDFEILARGGGPGKHP